MTDPLNNFTRCIALLGRRDEPTDGVEEYCQYLGHALSAENIALETVRVRWAECGWAVSLREIRSQWKDVHNAWFLLQYTALAWSKKGFPWRALRLLKFLQRHGARCAVVFHDVEPYEGARGRDRARRTMQLYVMRELLGRSAVAIVTVPREKISWIGHGARNVRYIPVGANLPNPEAAWFCERDAQAKTPVVAVFTVTPGPARAQELHRIAEALSYAAKSLGRLQAIFLGRNSELGGAEVRKELAGQNVDVRILGLLRAEAVVQALGGADVLLFTRAPLSSRRGSALAGIACGLPVVAREGSETGPPITEAGVVLLPRDSVTEYGPALVRVLSDENFRASLAKRSRKAQTEYFSWSVIASQYVAALTAAGRGKL